METDERAVVEKLTEELAEARDLGDRQGVRDIEKALKKARQEAHKAERALRQTSRSRRPWQEKED